MGLALFAVVIIFLYIKFCVKKKEAKEDVEEVHPPANDDQNLNNLNLSNCREQPPAYSELRTPVAVQAAIAVRSNNSTARQPGHGQHKVHPHGSPVEPSPTKVVPVSYVSGQPTLVAP